MMDTARMLAQNDIRLIWREGFFFIFIMLVLPALAFFIRVVTPEVTQLVSPWVMLEDYYGLILATAFVASQPVLLGFVIGVLFVEERDSGTLLALQASPLSLRSFMAYRVIATMLLNVLLTVISVELTGLVSISLIESIIAASLASLGVPVTALIYGVYIKNKVQAIMMMKPIAAWGQLPVLLFFVTSPWQWIGSLFLPLYYPMRFFWTASSDHAEWWLLVPGLVIPGIMILWLFNQFKRRVVG
jgi:fluoroquinolone transport system permease protein